MEFQQIKEWANNPMVCISGLVKENFDTLIAAVESLTAEKEAVMALQWIKGEPPYPYGDEWFIARTIHRERVVLRSLPKEYSYDYTTADGTYMKRKNITAWMQFPDSTYKSFALTAAESSLAQAREEIERLKADNEKLARGYGLARATYALSLGDITSLTLQLEAAEPREKELVELIASQPHHYLCETQYEINGSCDCWKSKASVLTEAK